MASLAALATELSAADFTSIPVIDMSNAKSPDFEKRKALAEEVRKACLNEGFFVVVNHGVPLSVVEATEKQAGDFFRLPTATKATVDISKSDQFRGYMGALTENNDPANKGDNHEAFNLGNPDSGNESASDSKLQHAQNLWPSSDVWAGADEFKKDVLAYYKEVVDFGLSLFRLFALALDKDEHFFDDKTLHPAAIMRLLFYPAVSEEAADERMPGIGDHTDFECFTILRQCTDVRALQVANRNGQWIDAPYIHDSFVINIGDQFQRWTNDIFKSTRHRVLPARAVDRYSIPLFFGVDHDVVMDPISTCVSEDRPNRYEVMKAGDYVHMRLSDIYAPALKDKPAA